MTSITGRRRAIIAIPLEQLVAWLDMTDGLRPVTLHANPLRDTIDIVVEGDTLDPTPTGVELPRMSLTDAATKLTNARTLPTDELLLELRRRAEAAGLDDLLLLLPDPAHLAARRER